MSVRERIRAVAILPIRCYQRLISPLKPHPTCRFSPTCSHYATQAISQRGIFVGAALAAWRILRCNPLCRGGYDPVPPAHKAAELPQVPRS